MVTLRDATIDDLDTLMKWDTMDHVVASDPNDDWNWEIELRRKPNWRDQLVAEVDGVAIGFIQIIDPAAEDSKYWGDVGPNKRAVDIWIGEPSYLGKGYGSQMMKMALDRCFSRPEVTEVLIDPLSTNYDAIRFYTRLGFEFLERRSFGLDECDVYKMTRDRWSEKSLYSST